MKLSGCDRKILFEFFEIILRSIIYVIRQPNFLNALDVLVARFFFL